MGVYPRFLHDQGLRRLVLAGLSILVVVLINLMVSSSAAAQPSARAAGPVIVQDLRAQADRLLFRAPVLAPRQARKGFAVLVQPPPVVLLSTRAE